MNTGDRGKTWEQAVEDGSFARSLREDRELTQLEATCASEDVPRTWEGDLLTSEMTKRAVVRIDPARGLVVEWADGSHVTGADAYEVMRAALTELLS